MIILIDCSLIKLVKFIFVCFEDLENASPTENPPCSARFLCPNSYIQNLGGCDAATGECICERGYDLDHGVCVGKQCFWYDFVTWYLTSRINWHIVLLTPALMSSKGVKAILTKHPKMPSFVKLLKFPRLSSSLWLGSAVVRLSLNTVTVA